MAVIDAPPVAAPAGGGFLIPGTQSAPTFTPEDFTEVHQQVRTTAQRFMREEVLPQVPQLEAKETGLTRKLVEQAGELGLLGVTVPERYEGLEMDLTTQMVVSECVGSYASFSTTYGAHAGIGTLPVVFFGTEAQKRAYLPRLVNAELLGAYCLSEAHAGSDSLAARTRATLAPDGQHYTLNGQKMWISNGGWADLYTVFAKVDGERFTAFLVERAWPGVKPGAEEHKMGLLGSSTTALYLDNVKVPVGNVLGEVGRGHVIAFNVLNLGRLELGASCVGGAKCLMADSVAYALQRRAFGRPIAEFGAIRQKLADMEVQTFAGESLIYRTSGLIDARLEGFSWDAPDATGTALRAVEEYAVECSVAKVYLSEALDSIVDEAVQIHGGNGYHRDYSVERGYRDSRINRIFEGTNEINRLLAAGMLLKRAAQGRLALLEGIAAAASHNPDAAPAAPEPLPGGDTVDQAKRCTLAAVGLAYQRFGADFERQQEVAAALSDLLMAVYALESAVLRAQKLPSGERRAHAQDILVVLSQTTMNLVRERAELILGACCAGDALEAEYRKLQRLAQAVPADLPAARDRIAGRVLAAGGYCG